MGRKGVTQRKYSQEFIDQVVKEYQKEGYSGKYLADKYGIPKGTIMTWAHKYRMTGTTARKKRGRDKRTQGTDYKEKYEILKKYLEFLEEVEQEKK